MALISPSMRRHQPPPFWEMAEDDFEDLCRDILDSEAGISTCFRYGTKGHTQHGIDLWAERSDADGIEVAQCKRYKAIAKGKFKTWSDEFLSDWDYWQQQRVRRFILYVACIVDKPTQIEAIHEERKRFLALGVEYEVRDGRGLTSSLSPLPQVVSRFLGPMWVEPLCGVTPPLSIHAPSDMVVAAQNPAHDVISHLETHNVTAIETAMETWRRGYRVDTVRQLSAIRDDEVEWQSLGAAGQANLLRVQARLAIDAGQSVQARRLQNEAHVLDHTTDISLEGLLRHQEEGAQATLTWLESQDEPVPHLHVALLLELGNPEAALALLATIGDQADAETFRLRAIAHVEQGDLVAAQSAADEALNLQPQWVAVRYVAAVISYYQTLSPAARPRRITAWPEPLPWSLLRRDRVSLVTLDRLALEFATLSALASDVEESHRLRLWQAAALLNHPDHQTDAHTLLSDLLSESPPDYRAWLWAFARNVPVDHRAIVAAMGRQIRDGTVSVPQVLVLVNYHLTTGATSKARKVLDNTRLLFQQQGEAESWVAWNQALKAVGSRRSTLPGPDPITATPVQRQATLEALSQRASESGDHSAVRDYLRGCYTATGDAKYLLWLCEVLVLTRDWTELASHARVLIEQIGTEESVYLAVVGSFNAADPYTALSLLSEGRDLFTNRELPPELERLSIRALQQTGQHQKALHGAELLVQRDPSTQNLLALIDVHAGQGDVASVARVATRLQGVEDLTAEQALYIAGLIRGHPFQATGFLRAAFDVGIDDNSVAQAVSLAHALGVSDADPVIADLTRRLAVLGHGDNAHVRIVTLNELRQILLDLHQQEAELTALYRTGQIPIHLLERYNLSILSGMYHNLLDANSEDLEQRGLALYIRHGRHGTTLLPVTEQGDVRLHMDVTALLLAYHFGILDVVEQVFAPLRLPPDLPRTLTVLWSNLQPHQPQRLDAQRRVVEAVAERWVTPISVTPDEDEAWLAIVQGQSGKEPWKVDFGTHLPQDRTLGTRDILETLAAAGVLSAADANHIRLALGTESSAETGMRLPRRSVLYCAPGLAEFLATTGLLPAARRYYTLFLPQFDIDHMRAEVRGAAIREANAIWVDTLRERLARGLENGTYTLMPVPAAMPREGEGLPQTGAEACLYELTATAYEANDVVWIDDRCMSRYLRCGTAPLVGLLDVASWLKQWGRLSEPQYYDLLYRMRLANVRHLPLMADELLYHLQNASVEEGSLVETAELRVLRRYYAQGLRTPGVLQPPGLPDQPGEVEWLIATPRAISETLAGLWERRMPDVATYAEWVLESLYYEAIDVATLLNSPHPTNPAQIAATTLLSLILVHLRLETELLESPKAYHMWLEARLLTPRFRAAPALKAAVVDGLKHILAELADTPHIRVPRPVLMDYCLPLLPPMLQAALLEDDAWLEAVGLRKQEQIEMADAKFEPTIFWNALATAYAGEEVTLTERHQGRSVTFKVVDGVGAGWVFDETPDVPFTIEDAYQGLLHPDPDTQYQFLREHRAWFNLETAPFEQAVADIMSAEDVETRIKRTREYWERSSTFYYDRLRERIATHQPLRETDLLPPAGNILLSTRLDTSTPFSDHAHYDTAATTLLESVGIREAIQQLWSLPVTLPTPLLDAIAGLTRVERRQLYRDLIRRAHTPITQMHVLRLLGSSTPSPWIRYHARLLLERLVSEEGHLAIVSLIHMVHWSFVRLYARSESFTSRLATAWVHAHRMYELLSHPRYNLADIAIWLGDQVGIDPELFQSGSSTPWDVAHPNFMEPAALLVGGISVALSGYDEDAKASTLRHALAAPVWQRDLQNWWLRDLGDLPDALNTWIRNSDPDVWRTLLNSAVIESLARVRDETEPAVALQCLAEAPTDIQAWMNLGIRRGLMPAPLEWWTPLGTASLALDFSNSLNAEQDTTILLVASILLRSQDDAVIAQHLQTQWERIVEYLRNQENNDETIRHLLGLVFHLGTLCATETEVHQYISRSICRLADIAEHPLLLRHIVQRLRSAFPPELATFYDMALADLNARIGIVE